MPRSFVRGDVDRPSSSLTISQIHARAKSLTSGPVEPLPTQGRRSYTMYTTPSQDTVVQFRFASHFIPLDILELATGIHGDLVPRVSFEGEMGEDDWEKGLEPQCVYVTTRVRGITRREFMKRLPYETTEQRSENAEAVVGKANAIFGQHLARFLSLAWRTPQAASMQKRQNLKSECTNRLQTLRVTLPNRFQPSIETCVAYLDAIIALPWVLQHRDLNDANIFVDASTGRLTGVIGWTDATVLPFGMNLHTVEAFNIPPNLDGECEDSQGFKTEAKVFWAFLKDEIKELDDDTLRIIKRARLLGVLMDDRLAVGEENPEDEGIPDGKLPETNMESSLHWLDGLLVDEKTRLDS